MSGDAEIARLRWQCRRGMLELDTLLLRYLNRDFPGLTPSERQTFIELLDCADQDLYNWLVAANADVPKRFTSLIEQIKKGAHRVQDKNI